MIPKTKIYHFSNKAIQCDNIQEIKTEEVHGYTCEVIVCDDVDNPGKSRVYKFPTANLPACVEERYVS